MDLLGMSCHADSQERGGIVQIPNTLMARTLRARSPAFLGGFACTRSF